MPPAPIMAMRIMLLSLNPLLRLLSRTLTRDQRPQPHRKSDLFRLELMLVQHPGTTTAVAQSPLCIVKIEKDFIT